MNPFAWLVDVLISIYINIVLLRFFLQYVRADFYNPLSMFVVKATDPLVKPLRKVIPGFGGIDWSCIIVAWILSMVKVVLVYLISGYGFSFSPLQLTLGALYDVLLGAIYLYVFLLFLQAILSWVSAGHTPITMVLHQLTEPVLRKVRKLLPSTGAGIDFTPMIAIIGLYFIAMLLNFYVRPLLERLWS